MSQLSRPQVKMAAKSFRLRLRFRLLMRVAQKQKRDRDRDQDRNRNQNRVKETLVQVLRIIISISVCLWVGDALPRVLSIYAAAVEIYLFLLEIPLHLENTSTSIWKLGVGSWA